MNKKLLFLSACALVSNCLYSTLEQDLALLNAQLSTLSKALPEVVPSPAAEAKAAQAITTENLDADIASLAQKAITILNQEQVSNQDRRILWSVYSARSGILNQLIELYWNAIATDNNNRITQLHRVLLTLYQHLAKAENFADRGTNPKHDLKDQGFDAEDSERPISTLLRTVDYYKKEYVKSANNPAESSHWFNQLLKFTELLKKIRTSKFLEKLGYKDKVQEELKALTALQEAAKPRGQDEPKAVVTVQLDPDIAKLRDDALTRIQKEEFGAFNQKELTKIIDQLFQRYLEAIAENNPQRIAQVHYALSTLAAAQTHNETAALYSGMYLTHFKKPISAEAIDAALRDIKQVAMKKPNDQEPAKRQFYFSLLTNVIKSPYIAQFPGLAEKLSDLLNLIKEPAPAPAPVSAAERKATSAAVEEVSIRTTKIKEPYIVQALDNTLSILGQYEDENNNKEKLFSSSPTDGHLNNLFNYYLDALAKNDQDRLMQAHAALYYIAHNFPLYTTPSSIFPALKSRGFNEQLLNPKAVEYELNRINAFAQLTPEQLKPESDAHTKKMRYEQQLNAWKDSTLLKKLFPALVPKITELLSKVQAMEISEA